MRRTVSLRATALLAALGPAASALIAAGTPRDPVAIVCARSGNVLVSDPSDVRQRSVELFQWVIDGARIVTEKDSSVTLAFSSGKRYELGGGASATVARDELLSQAGPVKALTSVPSLPRVAAIAPDSPVVSRAGAARIRGARVTGLYPRGDSRTLHDGTVLRFSPVAGATTYKVEVEDETGKTVFDTEVHSSSVAISPGILRPAARYVWRVRTLDRPGLAARGEEEFETLSADDAAQRALLKQALERSGDAASLPLLAEIDRRLGLLFDAREEFRTALAKSPENEGIRLALKRLDDALRDTLLEP